MAPGKGVHLVLNEEILIWLGDVLSKIENQYSDELHDENPTEVLDRLTESGWTKEKDGFGTKVYAAKPYRDNELRVTVVLTKQNELRLDIREWFEPK